MVNSIIFCDIDGTIVPTYFDSDQSISKEELDNIKRKTEREVLSKNIISILNIMIKNTKLVFLTGRPKEWEVITHKLLKPINRGKYDIHFLSIEGQWNREKYYKFKLDMINKLSIKYDIIYVIDDNINLLKYIKKYFNIKNRLFLFLINGVYNSAIKDMVIENRLM